MFAKLLDLCRTLDVCVDLEFSLETKFLLLDISKRKRLVSLSFSSAVFSVLVIIPLRFRPTIPAVLEDAERNSVDISVFCKLCGKW